MKFAFAADFVIEADSLQACLRQLADYFIKLADLPPYSDQTFIVPKGYVSGDVSCYSELIPGGRKLNAAGEEVILTSSSSIHGSPR